MGSGGADLPRRPAVPAADARRLRNELRLRALGIARAKAQECSVEPLDVGEAGEPAVVEGVKLREIDDLAHWLELELALPA